MILDLDGYHIWPEQRFEMLKRIPASKFSNISAPDQFKVVRSNFALPSGWERRMNDFGRFYYVNHNTQSTTWKHPVRQCLEAWESDEIGQGKWMLKEVPKPESKHAFTVHFRSKNAPIPHNMSKYRIEYNSTQTRDESGASKSTLADDEKASSFDEAMARILSL